MLSTDIYTKIDAKIDWCYSIARRYYRRWIPSCTFSCDLRGTTAGLSLYGLNHIRLNAQMILEHTDHFIDNYVPHEVAHAIVDSLTPDQPPHGDHWRSVMGLFDVEPRVRHPYPAEHLLLRKLTKYQYKCKCEEPAVLTSIIHNRIERGERYVCVVCKQKLINGIKIV